MENGTLIKTEKLVKSFPVGRGSFTALKDVDLTVRRGEFTGLVGPSGSGKTTLLNIIGALDYPTSGSVTVIGEDTRALDHKGAARLRNYHIGFIFQTYNLLPVYTVYENVEFPLLLLGMEPVARKEAVLEAIEWVGLSDKIDSRPAQLSGGESQRVAVARAMVKKPELVLADEPTANLDVENSHNILDLMVKLNEKVGSTFIFATHDEKVIRYLRRRITLIGGKIAEDVATVPVGSGGGERSDR